MRFPSVPIAIQLRGVLIVARWHGPRQVRRRRHRTLGSITHFELLIFCLLRAASSVGCRPDRCLRSRLRSDTQRLLAGRQNNLRQTCLRLSGHHKPATKPPMFIAHSFICLLGNVAHSRLGYAKVCRDLLLAFAGLDPSHDLYLGRRVELHPCIRRWCFISTMLLHICNKPSRYGCLIHAKQGPDSLLRPLLRVSLSQIRGDPLLRRT